MFSKYKHCTVSAKRGTKIAKPFDAVTGLFEISEGDSGGKVGGVSVTLFGVSELAIAVPPTLV